MTIRARFRVDYPGFAFDADVDLPSRGVSALFGPSGSGKTTLLRCIAGLERTPQGRLEIDGEVWQDDTTFVPTHRRPLGYVFQEANLFAHLSVHANLDFGRKRVTVSAHRVQWDRAIELLGIGHLLERKPDRLSGGERQRVAIARALLTSPRLLLMDEPLAALDQARKDEILPYLEHLHDELEIPVLYVSHAADEVARLADHLVVLEAGRVLGAGPLAETLARLDLPIRLGEDAGVVLDAIVAERDTQWQLARVAFAGGSLWVRDKGLDAGRHVRVRILARDVSIAREQITGTSIMNTFPATVTTQADDTHPALTLIKLDASGTPVLARLTKRSAANLQLEAGLPIWAQVKAVALIE
jgi:molybdate transport system ATP-binding protein